MEKVKGNVPLFKVNSELARYIDPDERNGDNHAAASAFLLSEEDLNSKNAHLSVNATECEPISRSYAPELRL